MADKDKDRKAQTIALHTRLRHLRREYGISPVAFLQINLFGEVFRESVTVTGKPAITLNESVAYPEPANLDN